MKHVEHKPSREKEWEQDPLYQLNKQIEQANREAMKRFKYGVERSGRDEGSVERGP